MRISDWSSDVCSSDLMRVDRQAAILGAVRLDLARKLRADLRSKGGIDAVERMRPGRQIEQNLVVPQQDAAIVLGELDACIAHGCKFPGGQFMFRSGRDQRYVGSIPAQEKSFGASPLPGTDDGDRAIGHLKTVADRAVTQPAAGQRLDVCLVIDHQRAAIDDPGGEQDGARAYRKFSGLSDEAVLVLLKGLHMAVAACREIEARLLPPPRQQIQ